MENKGENKLPEKIIIRGGKKLSGTINVQGAKNAALPVMAAAILLKNASLTLSNVPDLYDIRTMCDLLRNLGASVEFEGHSMRISVPEKLNTETPTDLVRKMRASSLVLGPLVARWGHALLPLPGGCVLGSRPLDFHLKGLSKMGADIELKNGAVSASSGRLNGASVTLDYPSVGATENIMMAATLAAGTTCIENAAKEPEIVNLADVLRLMGADIKGDGTERIVIIGREELSSASGYIIPDRIEAATYMMAGVITGGDVTLKGIEEKCMEAILNKMRDAGAEFAVTGDSVSVRVSSNGLKGISVKTLPFPGFPTDTQPQIMALLSVADGTSIVNESVFDSRLLHINEFKKFGARIEMQDNVAIITGVKKLNGTVVHSSNLRAGAALIIMGLAAEGETTVCDLQHVWRGYESLGEKLRTLGADIEFED
ncbi:MAG: UDP-N-acetylglucosamine 1-carboxyvinyltransferase [Synergistes sp.]|nr:UDP-N-acetylglucosamine 1-carboxyvinyltransferase [Synergistes sp.]